MMDDQDGTRAEAGTAAPTGAGHGAAGNGAAAAHAAESNRLLRALPADEYARIVPALVPTRLRLGDVLVEPDAPIRDVHFPRDGAASVIATVPEGGGVEVGTIGCEGFVGLPVLTGAGTMPNRVIVQVEGRGWRLAADAFGRLVEERPVVRRLLLRYAQSYVDQVSQAAACHRLHGVDQRCARWLLATHDRVGGDAFDLTHESLAAMLGVRRAGVTVAMGVLQAHGVVRYARGRMRIVDRAGLEAASCTCHATTRAARDRLVG